MKRILSIVFALLLFPLLAIAQPIATTQVEYTIINVKGIIKKLDGTQLKKGLKLMPSDKLKFSKDAVMLIHNLKAGRVIVQPSLATNTKIDLDFPLSAFLTITQRTFPPMRSVPMLKKQEDFTLIFKIGRAHV